MKQIIHYVGVLLAVSLCSMALLPVHTSVVLAASVVNAGSFPGGDVGAKINAADASLGSQPGEIQVSGGGVISSRVVISPNHTLRFGAGTYTLVNEPILMREHTQVVGSGWDTILVEPTGSRWFVIASYNGTMAQGISGPIDEDQVVRDLQIKGANPNWDSAQSTIWFGNVHRAIVTNVWFNGTRANGVSAGGWGINGNYAEDVWIVNNKFTQVAAQEANGINVRRMTVANNVFEKPGAPDGPFQAVIDMEPNVVEDKMEEVAILNNTLDDRGSARCNSSNFIVYQPFSGATTYTGGPAIIAGNSVMGLADDHSCTYNSNGILITKASHDVQIFDNTLAGCGQNGLYLDGGVNISVYNNTITNCGTGGNEAVRVGATHSYIFNNTITAPWGAANTQIVETGNASNNVYYNNGTGPYTLQPTSRQVLNTPTPPAILKANNPTISMANGLVVITSTTPYGEVHYTTDGSNPTLLSPLYTEPFNSTATIKAKVFRAGQYDSDVIVQTGTSVAPPPAIPPPPPAVGTKPAINTFTSFSNGTTGTPATLTWQVSGATSLSIDQGVGDVTGKTSVTVTPQYTKSYTLTATNMFGVATATVGVTVQDVQPLPLPPPTPVPAPPSPAPVPAAAPMYSTNTLVNDNGTIYLINGQVRLPFTSMAVFRGLGYVLQHVIQGSTVGYKNSESGYMLASSTQAHPWGAWVQSGRTIYYVDVSGLVAVSQWDIFVNNGGAVEYIVPANAADLKILKANPKLRLLQYNDARVVH